MIQVGLFKPRTVPRQAASIITDIYHCPEKREFHFTISRLINTTTNEGSKLSVWGFRVKAWPHSPYTHLPLYEFEGWLVPGYLAYKTPVL